MQRQWSVSVDAYLLKKIVTHTTVRSLSGKNLGPTVIMSVSYTFMKLKQRCIKPLPLNLNLNVWYFIVTWHRIPMHCSLCYHSSSIVRSTTVAVGISSQIIILLSGIGFHSFKTRSSFLSVGMLLGWLRLAVFATPCFKALAVKKIAFNCWPVECCFKVDHTPVFYLVVNCDMAQRIAVGLKSAGA